VKPKLEKFCKNALKFVGWTLACWQAGIPQRSGIFFFDFNNLGATQGSGFTHWFLFQINAFVNINISAVASRKRRESFNKCLNP